MKNITLKKGTKIKVIDADKKISILTLNEDITSKSIYTEGRPIRKIECFNINGSYIPVCTIIKVE